ncbi:8447_t:CDS:2, partial [Funneliformis caledonium]
HPTALQTTTPVRLTSITFSVRSVTAWPITALIHLVTVVTPTALQITTPTCQSGELIERYLNIRILRIRKVWVSENNPHELPRMPNVNRLISLNESNTTAVRIPVEYQLNYEKTFSEQVITIYENLILELKRMMEGVFNLSVTQLSNWLKAIHKHRVLDPMAEQQANNNNKYYETDKTNKMNKFINYDYFDAEDNMNDKDYLTNLFFAEEIEDYDEK